MAKENKPQEKKSFSFDWLVGGVLTKVGDTFDRLTGRNWNPSSSLATSKLIEKLKFLLDSEVRDLGKKGSFVPHIIKLKIQWDKFSTEAEENLDKLEHELHAAMIDHINDKLYHTFAPIKIEIKTDYFTDGVKMLSSFGKFSDEPDDEVAINVTVPSMNVNDLIKDDQIVVNLNEQKPIEDDDCFIARWTANNKSRELELNFTKNKRISVGRSKENHLHIDDTNVSGIHAALVLNNEKQLMVADTGSTNGTFINGQRIAYGKAIMFDDDATVKFGTVEVTFERLNSFVEEKIYNEPFEAQNELEVIQDQTLPEMPQTLANHEIKPTEAGLGKLEKELANQDVTATFSKEVVKPIESKTENYSKPPETFEDSESESISQKPNSDNDTNNSEKSVDINLDKTQDWEV